MSNWIRARFHADADDYRPIKWPPVGPYWYSGYALDGSYIVVIAYVRNIEQVREYWPEADEIRFSEESEIRFTERFPKPEWWNGGEQG